MFNDIKRHMKKFISAALCALIFTNSSSILIAEIRNPPLTKEAKIKTSLSILFAAGSTLGISKYFGLFKKHSHAVPIVAALYAAVTAYIVYYNLTPDGWLATSKNATQKGEVLLGLFSQCNSSEELLSCIEQNYPYNFPYAVAYNDLYAIEQEKRIALALLEKAQLSQQTNPNFVKSCAIIIEKINQQLPLIQQAKSSMLAHPKFESQAFAQEVTNIYHKLQDIQEVQILYGMSISLMILATSACLMAK